MKYLMGLILLLSIVSVQAGDNELVERRVIWLRDLMAANRDFGDINPKYDYSLDDADTMLDIYGDHPEITTLNDLVAFFRENYQAASPPITDEISLEEAMMKGLSFDKLIVLEEEIDKVKVSGQYRSKHIKKLLENIEKMPNDSTLSR